MSEKENKEKNPLIGFKTDYEIDQFYEENKTEAGQFEIKKEDLKFPLFIRWKDGTMSAYTEKGRYQTIVDTSAHKGIINGFHFNIYRYKDAPDYEEMFELQQNIMIEQLVSMANRAGLATKKEFIEKRTKVALIINSFVEKEIDNELDEEDQTGPADNVPIPDEDVPF